VVVADLSQSEYATADIEGLGGRLGLRAALVAPLRQGPKGLGALYVAAKGPVVYGEEDAAIGKLLAEGLSAGLETARLFQSVADERSMMEAVLASTRDAILTVNLQGTVLLANRAVRDMLGVNEMELIGRPLTSVVADGPLRDLFGHGEAGVVEVPLGDGRTAQASLVPVTSPFGEPIGWAAVLRDITVLKELEGMKNEFVNTVSHDLKNPLSSILLAADLLGRAGELNERQVGLQGRIVETVGYMNELVGDLLNLGRIEAGLGMVKEEFDLVALGQDVYRALQLRAEAKGQTVSMEMPEQVMVTADRGQIRQVLMNLVGNGIKYTPDKGNVRLVVRQTTGEERGAWSEERGAGDGVDGPLVVVKVVDNGVGIPAADLPYVFDKFYRVKGGATEGIKGTGLGLAIARSIVEGHGGRIWAESVEGAGSVFAFYLPV
jgi:PAS domain S-box-containing protein